MQRWKIIIEYEGSQFNGWQSQKDGSGIQDNLEKAIKNYSKEDIKTFSAGRTDSGVHALGQVVHFDLKKESVSDEVRDALNNYLRPKAISIIKAERADENFHARFSAKLRHYEYRIINRRQPLTIDRGRYWRVGQDLEVDLMDKAKDYLIGKHDFTTFRSTHCQAKSPVKTLDDIQIKRKSDVISFKLTARSFLHNQVRSIVGSLKLVGEKKWKPIEIKNILDARDRKLCAPLAPAEGLYFLKVLY